MSARIVLAAALLVVSATLLLAKDLKTVVIVPNGTHTIHVPGSDILRIRNFTQEDGSTRGTVSVTIDGVMANVMVATIIDASDTTSGLEPINSIIIAGRAMVTVTCPSDATSCVLSYRKGDDHD